MSLHTLNLRHIYALTMPITLPSIKANMHTIADCELGVNQYCIQLYKKNNITAVVDIKNRAEICMYIVYL
jgi:hypothetical protein